MTHVLLSEIAAIQTNRHNRERSSIYLKSGRRFEIGRRKAKELVKLWSQTPDNAGGIFTFAHIPRHLTRSEIERRKNLIKLARLRQKFN